MFWNFTKRAAAQLHHPRVFVCAALPLATAPVRCVGDQKGTKDIRSFFKPVAPRGSTGDIRSFFKPVPSNCLRQDQLSIGSCKRSIQDVMTPQGSGKTGARNNALARGMAANALSFKLTGVFPLKAFKYRSTQPSAMPSL